jgi:hypothetical protein
MAKFILVSRDKEDLYVNVDRVRVLRAQSGGGGTTIFFDMEHTITVMMISTASEALDAN